MYGVFCPYRSYGSGRSCLAIITLLLYLSLSPAESVPNHRAARSIYDASIKEYLLTDLQYGLTDRAVHSYNDFCQGLETSSTSVPYNLQSNATLYLLSQRPPRTDREQFSISKLIAFKSGDIRAYHSYMQNMYAGTRVVINACYPVAGSDRKLEFYLLKGTKNFNKWVDDWIFHDPSYSEKHSTLSSTCQTISYQTQKEDKYYFVFYREFNGDGLNADFQIDRPVYHVLPDTVSDSCTIPLDGYSSCSLSVPLSSGYTALLSLNASLPIDYTDGADISIKCQPRGWLYVVVVISVLVGVILSVVLLVVFIRTMIKRRKKRNAYSLVLGSESQSTSRRGVPQQNENVPMNNNSMKSVAGSVPSANPPPYNPVYSPYPGGSGYGATPNVPPPSYSEI